MTALAAPFAGCGGEAFEAPATSGAGRVEILIGGQPYSAFHFGDEWDKPFLHPLSTPSGVVVTRGFPLQPLPGESQDHPWHRGLIWGHGLINGRDFWREQGRDKTARMIPRTAPALRGDDDAAVVEAELDMTPPDGKAIGTCLQTYRIRSAGGGIEIDAQITVSADLGQPLTFGDTEDGGFGFRFHDSFRQDRGAQLLNSEGLAGSENIWGKRARWVQYSAQISGKAASVTMFDHPENLRHPTYWHARDYGLCAANPFGVHDFLADPAQDGSHTVVAGDELVFRYRVVIADGVTPPGNVDRLFEAYGARC